MTNKKYYWKTLTEKLRLLTSMVKLLHDNALQRHTTWFQNPNRIAYLTFFIHQWFSNVEEWHFDTDRELNNYILNYFEKLDGYFYKESLFKLIWRLERCLKLDDNYIEK